MTHSTETAQRRLLEALATVRNTKGLDYGAADSPLSAVAIGLRFAASIQAASNDREQIAMGLINAAVADLCEAVNDEMKGARRG